MAVRLSLDTSFLIDVQREERRRYIDGPAHRFLRQNSNSELFLSVVGIAEYVRGFPRNHHPAIDTVRELVELIAIDDETALIYANIGRELRNRGTLIGTNDTWIGSASLQHGLPLVTANTGDFGRIEGLELITYREPY